MTAAQYPVFVHWSAEDRAFLAECPQLPGCMTHGRTLEEAFRNSQEAIRAWVKGAWARGQTVPPPLGTKPARRRQLILRVDPDLQAKLLVLSRVKGRSVNVLATECLDRLVKEEMGR